MRSLGGRLVILKNPIQWKRSSKNQYFPFCQSSLSCFILNWPVANASHDVTTMRNTLNEVLLKRGLNSQEREAKLRKYHFALPPMSGKLQCSKKPSSPIYFTMIWYPCIFDMYFLRSELALFQHAISDRLQKHSIVWLDLTSFSSASLSFEWSFVSQDALSVYAGISDEAANFIPYLMGQWASTRAVISVTNSIPGNGAPNLVSQIWSTYIARWIDFSLIKFMQKSRPIFLQSSSNAEYPLPASKAWPIRIMRYALQKILSVG